MDSVTENSKVYVMAPEKEAHSCNGCALRNSEACGTVIPDFFCNAHKVIWVEKPEAQTDKAVNDIQIGGGHYKERAIQPWDYIAANGLDFFQGNVVKYVTRFREKNGVQDLQKARHYIDKLIEIESEKSA